MLVDEAYADFADDNCLSLPGRRPNVLVTRTFSKGYGLAGLRFGYAIGDPEVIAQMAKVKDSYNCDAIAIAAACAALEDVEYARANWQAIRAERARLSSELERRRLAVIPSQANFLLVTTPDAGPCGMALRRPEGTRSARPVFRQAGTGQPAANQRRRS